MKENCAFGYTEYLVWKTDITNLEYDQTRFAIKIEQDSSTIYFIDINDNIIAGISCCSVEAVVFGH